MAEKRAGWMSIGEAAKYLGISRDTLRRWEKKGKIKPIRSPTNRRYYTKNQLEELMSGEKAIKKAPGKKTKAKLQPLLAGIVSTLLAVIIALAIIFFFVR